MKNLLLLGDSIRMGYDSFVKEKLAGKMNVYFPEDNGRFVQYTLRAISDWKGQLELPEIQVIHWNNGLWDAMHLSVNTPGDDGEAAGDTFVPATIPEKLFFEKDALTPPEIYRYMLGRVFTRLRNIFPEAEIIFATTTPVLEEQSTWAFRSNAEIDEYNHIARETLLPMGCRINELGEFARKNCSSFHRDWVHYTDEGSSLLAQQIIDYLQQESIL
jgi:hypothetical protein